MSREQRTLDRVPRALDELAALERRLERGRVAVFLDYDGTLPPIVGDPDAATLDPSMRAVVAALAERLPVAIVSGRDREDVQRRVGLSGIYYAGGHGFDIAGPGRQLEHPGGAAALPSLEAAERDLRERLAAVEGARVERKRFSVAVHYRHVEEARVAEVVDAVRAALRDDLAKSEGKKVLELGPRVDWHKGRAVDWLLEALELRGEDVTPVFVGDDLTDENAFRSLGERGVGVLVGDPGAMYTHADLRVADVGEVEALLRHLAAWAARFS
jgi:trehalose 6-phosphate phosphatase